MDGAKAQFCVAYMWYSVENRERFDMSFNSTLALIFRDILFDSILISKQEDSELQNKRILVPKLITTLLDPRCRFR